MNEAVLLWRREWWSELLAATAGVAVVVGGVLAELGPAPTVASAAIVAAGIRVATVERRLLAETNGGLVLFRVARTRRVAVALIDTVSPLTIEEAPGGSLLPAWHVDGMRYRSWPGCRTTLARMIDRSLQR